MPDTVLGLKFKTLCRILCVKCPPYPLCSQPHLKPLPRDSDVLTLWSELWTLLHPGCLCPGHCSPLSYWPADWFSFLQPHTDLPLLCPLLWSWHHFYPPLMLLFWYPGPNLTSFFWSLGPLTSRPGTTPDHSLIQWIFIMWLPCARRVPGMGVIAVNQKEKNHCLHWSLYPHGWWHSVIKNFSKFFPLQFPSVWNGDNNSPYSIKLFGSLN